MGIQIKPSLVLIDAETKERLLVEALVPTSFENGDNLEINLEVKVLKDGTVTIPLKFSIW